MRAGKSSFKNRIQQEKSYQSDELFFLGFEKVLKMQASVMDERSHEQQRPTEQDFQDHITRWKTKSSYLKSYLLWTSRAIASWKLRHETLKQLPEISLFKQIVNFSLSYDKTLLSTTMGTLYYFFVKFISNACLAMIIIVLHKVANHLQGIADAKKFFHIYEISSQNQKSKFDFSHLFC